VPLRVNILRALVASFSCCRIKQKSPQKSQEVAHREGRTRSLQIGVVMRPCTRHKSLTLYPIELGGQLTVDKIRATRPYKHTFPGLIPLFVYAHSSPLYKPDKCSLFVVDESNIRGVQE
jgi:hypothetical protein